jgi:Na+/melibiose symporter-like transporter
MTKIAYRKKRNKATRILLAPLFAVVFLIGWTLYYLGEPKHKQIQKPLSKETTQTESVHLMLIPPQQEQTIPA